MRLLVPVFALLLVSCGRVPEQPAPNPAVRIVSHAGSIQASERPRYSITGELVNESSTPVYGARVHAKLYDSLDRPLAELSNTAALQGMLPGQRNPFFLTLSADAALLQAVDHYKLSVASSVKPPTSTNVVPLIVTRHRLQLASSPSGQTLSITGEVTNSSGMVLRRVVIVGTLYDEQGRMSSIAIALFSARMMRGKVSLTLGTQRTSLSAPGLSPKGARLAFLMATPIPSRRRGISAISEKRPFLLAWWIGRRPRAVVTLLPRRLSRGSSALRAGGRPSPRPRPHG